MLLQGIILKENGNIGDAERMFIQVSIWMSFIHMAPCSCTKIYPQFITFIHIRNKTSYDFFFLLSHAGTVLCTRESQVICGPLLKEMITDSHGFSILRWATSNPFKAPSWFSRTVHGLYNIKGFTLQWCRGWWN